MTGSRSARARSLAAWSFHPRKLITTGEGGMVTTDDAEWAARLRRLREHGMNVSAADRHASAQPVLESYLETGFNYRMTDIQAAVGLVQLRPARRAGRPPPRARRALPGAARRRAGRGRRCATRRYGTTNYQSFWVLLDRRSARPRRRRWPRWPPPGISARRGIMAAHLEPAYAGVAADRCRSPSGSPGDSLILPLHHEMTADDQRVRRRVSCASWPLMTTDLVIVGAGGFARETAAARAVNAGRTAGCSGSSTTTRRCTARPGAACRSSGRPRPGRDRPTPRWWSAWATRATTPARARLIVPARPAARHRYATVIHPSAEVGAGCADRARLGPAGPRRRSPPT